MRKIYSDPISLDNNQPSTSNYNKNLKSKLYQIYRFKSTNISIVTTKMTNSETDTADELAEIIKIFNTYRFYTTQELKLNHNYEILSLNEIINNKIHQNLVFQSHYSKTT